MRVKDAKQTFLGIWIRMLLEDMPIKVFGDGMQLRDFNYVDDCIEALMLAGASDIANGKVYNLGSKEIIGLKALAEIMIDLGFGGSYELIPFPSDRKAIDIGDYYGDFSLISKDLGWLPKIGLNDGLRRSINYFKANHLHYWDKNI